MKYFVLAMLLLVYLTVQTQSAETTYTTKYDGIDLDEILGNDRLLTSYVNCLLEKGPCTPDGKELRDNLPDAIENDCKKCTERQKEGADQVMHFIIDNRPEDWNLLEEKYKSDGSYKLKYLSCKDSKKNKTDSTESETDENKTKE